MKPGWNQFSKADLEKLSAQVSSEFGTNLQRMFDDTARMLTNGATVADNFNAAVVTIRGAKHNTPTIFTNPLKNRPRFFTPQYAKLSNGAKALNVLGTVWIDDRVVNGVVDPVNMLATVNYDGRHTEPLLVKRLTSAMAIPNNSATTINTWQTDATAEVNRGGVISESGGTFTVSEAGSYSVALQLSYQEGVTYTNCQGRLQAAGGNNRFLPQISAALTDAAWIAFPAIFNLAAGATFVAQGFQTNAAAASRNLLSGNGNTRIAVNRLYNSTVDNYTADVTGILWGG